MKYNKVFRAFLIIIVASLLFPSFQPIKNNNPGQVKVLIVTDYGTIKIKLYNEAPLHRDNFVKLVKEHYYDSLLFHRVIQNFMIQGGDPDSKRAASGVMLGDGGPGYTIPREINQKLFHKKGVIAAARESDMENPSQASSGSQFYIVQGKTFTDSLLKIQAKRITKMGLFNAIINRPENIIWLEKYKKYTKAEQNDSMKYIMDMVNQKVEAELSSTPLYKFSEEQVKAYTTVGGTPHLDNSYTVFGEVYEGLEIVDRIAAEQTDRNNRPLNDIKIISVSIIE